jgi:hypothetical protein
MCGIIAMSLLYMLALWLMYACVGALDPMILWPMIQQFPMDGHFKTDVISGVGHPRSNLVVLLVLRTVQCAMAGTPALHYRSIETA